MDRKRIAVIAGTVIGTLSLATAAGAANFGLLRSSSDDPAPAVGNLDAGTVAEAGSSPSTSSDSVADGSTSTAATVPAPVPVDTSASPSTATSVDDHGGRRGGDDDGSTPSTTPVTAPGSRITVGGSFTPPAITTDDRSGSNSGRDDSDDSDRSDNSGHGSGSSGSGHGGRDDD